MPSHRATPCLLVAAALLTGCGGGEPAKEKKEAPAAGVVKQPFGQTAEGAAVDLYTLRNKSGMETSITNYGGIVVTLKTPDRKGSFADVTLGFDTLDGYLKAPEPYLGALIGRFSNRVGKARFRLDGVEYKLARNNGPNSLHGGLKGFDKQVWVANPVEGRAALELRYVSKDGEEGYPGTLTTKVTYSLTDANELRIAYEATTDRKTVLNLTNHAYFNLKGAGEGDILGHQLTLNADRFTPVSADLIPTGELRPVEGTPLDFRKPQAIGDRIDADDEQIKRGGGYDHNFVLNGEAGTLRKIAEVYEPESGRVMEVSTDQPGVQLYTGNFLDGTLTGKGGKTYVRRGGLCLETQHYPDSPNRKEFPSVVLKPGETFRSETVYRFSTR